MFGELRKEVGEILGKVCRMEEVTILKAATLPDHMHMYVSIPPKLSVSKAVSRIKGKGAHDIRQTSRISGENKSSLLGKRILLRNSR